MTTAIQKRDEGVVSPGRDQLRFLLNLPARFAVP